MTNPRGVFRFPSLVALALALTGGLAGGQAAPEPALKVSNTPMGSIVPGQALSMSISSDNNHVAVLSKVNDKYVVSVDGTEGKAYDWVVKSSLTFLTDNTTVAYIVQQNNQMFVVTGAKEGTPYHEIVRTELMQGKGGRLAYFARKTKDAKPVIVIDGQESKEYDEIGSFSFSPDGKRTAYGVRTAGQEIYIIDDTPGKAYDKIAGASFVWSPDSRHYAYAGIRGQGETGKVIPVIDAKEEPQVTTATRVLFSPDSQHYVYCTFGPDKKGAVVLDSKPQKTYDQVFSDTLHFSPDSQHLAYVVGAGETGKAPVSMNLVLDGADLKACDAIVGSTFRFSPDSKRTAYLAVRRGDAQKNAPLSFYYVVDGQDQREYPSFPREPRTGAIMPSFVFSPDSRRFAYVAVSRQNAFVVVIDGTEGKDYQQLDPRTAQFSPDSKHFAYLGLRKGPDGVSRFYAVVDNSEGVPYASVSNLLYNSDGSKLAYAAARIVKEAADKSRVEQFIVVNAQEGPSYTAVLGDTMAFSPDGAHLAYEARRDEKPFFVVDKQQTPEHGGSLLGSQIIWDGPSSFHALVKHDTRILRMEVEVPAGH